MKEKLENPSAYIGERDFRSATAEAAVLSGWEVYSVPDSRMIYPKTAQGFPDLVLLRPPRLLFVELKRESGKATDRQLLWLHRLSQIKKVEAKLWRPSDWEEIEKELAR